MDIDKVLQNIKKSRSSILGWLCCLNSITFNFDAYRNISKVFHNKIEKKDIIKLTAAYYTHAIFFFKELFILFFFPISYLTKKVELRGEDHLIKAASNKKGVIVLAAHTGSWEFDSILGLPQCRNYRGKFYYIRKKIRISFLNKFIKQKFKRANLGIILNDNKALLKSARLLKSNNAVIFVVDQRYKQSDKFSSRLLFFDSEVNFNNSVLRVAKLTGAPIVPLFNYRLKNKHVVKFGEELHIENDNIHEGMKKVYECLETIISEHPEQWIWSYNLWKS